MKKTILNLGKALAKNDQKTISGGSSNCGGYYCYAPSSANCGTCEEFLALSLECQLRVISHAACYQ
ncbi:hypothetical protein [uncultured Tenacibaculum sp.]|uniref:hypothetical protein n=1 Tax=uncultured Tenacibaculum sp. TaxID=174713 RepID=UPI0026162769|nr:hypothetical protein [uncultured Tenacibaculum sp.]